MPIRTPSAIAGPHAGACPSQAPGQRRRTTGRLAAGILASLAVPYGATRATAEALAPQPVFESQAGVLDLLMIAKRKDIELAGLPTTSWVYEICRRPAGGGDACPMAAGTENPYGGTRLQLQPGERLRIRLVNALPALTCVDAKHSAPDDIGAELLRNPTNLHTHGLIVEPRRATPGRPTYGDYVYVVVQNPDNPPHAPCPAPAAARATPPMTPGHQHGHGSITDVAQRAVEYDIRLPHDHPPGLFWFHPHAHGLALNQVSAGLAGSLTVGRVQDYLCNEPGCAALSGDKVRHLMLKDTQIEKAVPSGASNTMLAQQDPAFCDPEAASGDAPRQGFCPGAGMHADGRWVHSINGQVYPEIAVDTGGEVWRVTNAAGSRSYALSIDDGGRPLVVQVLSIDGVALDVPSGTSLSALRSMLGPKVEVVECPDRPANPATGDARRDGRETEPVCATGVRMMPSARVELWVARRDAGTNRLTVAAEPAQAVLRTAVYATGADPATTGDNWPAIDLAAVTFKPAAPGVTATSAPAPLRVQSKAASLLRPQGALVAAPTLLMPGAEQPVGIAAARDLAAKGAAAGAPAGLALAPSGGVNAISPEARLGLGQDPRCRTLPADHRRRVFFGKLQPNTDTFGLGYEEVDAQNKPVPGTEQPITAFNPSQISVCIRLPLIPLEPDGYQEAWELVNLTDEDHNFHVHQTRFQLLGGGPSSPAALPSGTVLQDNVPLLHGTGGGCDGTVASWRTKPDGAPGPCVSPAVVVRAPFSQVGDFVYHCHILEHEDGGMMARIRVMPAFALN